MRSTLVLLLPFVFTTRLSAQNATPVKPPLEPVAWMVGNWEGPANITLGPRGRTEIRQTERIEIESGGTAIAIRGRGFERTADGAEKVSFEAFAMLFRNRDGTLGFRAWNMEGNYIDPAVVVTPTGLVWSFDDPRGSKVRYTITHTPADEWHEVEEWSRDGTTWNQFMEMKLKRKQ